MRLLSTFVALALSTSAAMAGDSAPLSPGAPAGVKRAQEDNNIVLFTALGAGAVAAIAFVLVSGGNTTAPGTVVQLNNVTTTGTAP